MSCRQEYQTQGNTGVSSSLKKIELSLDDDKKYPLSSSPSFKSLSNQVTFKSISQQEPQKLALKMQTCFAISNDSTQKEEEITETKIFTPV